MIRGNWSNRNVFITGVTGFVGSALARKLKDSGANVVGLVKQVNHIPPHLNNITMVQGDVTDYDTLREAISFYEIDTIFHFAAFSIVRVSAQDPMSAYNVNIMGTVNLLEAARVVGRCSHIIVASSDKAYGDHEELPYTEEFALKPKNTYDASKACMDMIARSYAQNYDMPIIVTRCSNIYGPGDMNLSRLIPNTIRRVLNKESPMVYSDISNMEREFIFVDDVILAYCLLGSNDVQYAGEAFNIGGNGANKIFDVVTLISRLMNSDLQPQVTKRDRQFKEIEKQYIDARKIKNYYGWEFQTSLEDGLKKTIEWYTEYYTNGVYK